MKKYIRHTTLTYWNGRYKIETSYDITKPQLFSSFTSMKFRTSLTSDELKIEMKQIEEKYKKIIKDYLNLKRCIILFEYPETIKKNQFVLTISISALAREDLTREDLTNINQTLSMIFEDIIYKMNLIWCQPILHHRKKIENASI